MSKALQGLVLLLCIVGYNALDSARDTVLRSTLKRGGGYPPHRDLPFAGEGTCEEAVTGADGFTTVRCYGPAHPLRPGQAIDTMMLLASPYPADKRVAVVNMTAQLVEGAARRPVPLSEVYVHHYVARSQFLLGSGAELRGQMDRAPLRWPLSLVVDGRDAQGTEARLANIELLNTVGVAPGEDLARCVECWCPDQPDHGSFLCCRNCTTSADGGPLDYFLEYNVTFRPLEELKQEPQTVEFIGFDVTGGKVEYDILEPMGPGSVHRQEYEAVVDERCPQKDAFDVVRCSAHQHVGSRCLSVYEADTDKLVCRSCPVYGTEPDVPGNEDGFVVAMTDDNPSPPYRMDPGTKLRFVSEYSGEKRRLGVMGLMSLWVANLSRPCTGQFGYNGALANHLAPLVEPIAA